MKIASNVSLRITASRLAPQHQSHCPTTASRSDTCCMPASALQIDFCRWKIPFAKSFLHLAHRASSSNECNKHTVHRQTPATRVITRKQSYFRVSPRRRQVFCVAKIQIVEPVNWRGRSLPPENKK